MRIAVGNPIDGFIPTNFENKFMIQITPKLLLLQGPPEDGPLSNGNLGNLGNLSAAVVFPQLRLHG